MRPLVYIACSILALSFSALAANWPEWRGPDGQGHAEGGGYPVTWSETSNVAWKTAIPGRGWSSPVIWGNQIWMTTALEVAAPAEKQQERLKSNTNDQPLTLLEELKLHAVCLDRASGKLLHDVELLTLHDPQWVHQMNSYASPTPVIEQGRLYCHFGTFGTACVDTTNGKVLWTNTDLHLMHENGPGGSPVLWKNLLIFHGDGSDVQFVAALDKQSGKVAWKTDRSGKLEDKPITRATYSTPLLVGAQLVSTGPNWLYGYDPASGRELWKMPYDTQGFAMSARAVTGNGMVYYSTGFMKAHLQAVKLGTASLEIVWDYPKGVPTMSSPLLVDDLIYFVHEGGILTCLAAKTGKQIYRERMEGEFYASPLLAAGRMYFFSAGGKSFVVAPGKDFQVLATNELQGRQMASPAAVDGALFIRTDKALYKISAAK